MTRRTDIFRTGCCLVAALAGVAGAQSSGVQGLGVLPSQLFSIPATASSVGGGGSVLLGTGVAASGIQTASIRTGGVLTGIVPLPGANSTIAASVSEHGRVIVGFCLGGGIPRAFRRVDGMMMDLGLPPVANASFPRPAGVSADGSVVAGIVATGQGGLQTLGWRWTSQGFAIVNLLPGGTSNYVRGLSGDGATLVGEADSFGQWLAITWDATSGTRVLPSPDTLACVARGVNGDGSVIVGTSGPVEATRGVAWVDRGLRVLPRLAPADATWQATSVAANADVIGGESGGRACIWSLGYGRVMAVEDLLAVRGEDLSKWRLTSVTSVSADGTVLAGAGERVLPDGSRRSDVWMVAVSSICLTDWNSDGGIDGADVTAFFDAWEQGKADINLDGGTDGADIDEFFARWERGDC
ncbi:MAG: hypothetical protein WCK33_07990 [Phycisphaerae bacterium]